MLDLEVKKYYKSKPDIPDQPALASLLQKTFPKVPAYTSPTEIGIEVEIEKIGAPPMGTNIWMIDKDGSLKDNGYEFISRPIKDRNILFALEELEVYYKALPKAEFTHRCSIHVHMNVAKLKCAQLRALLATYIVLEPFYFSLVGKYREGNSYCYPLADAFPQWEWLKLESLNENFKYAALNPHHLRDYGTLEFRHHGGTKNKTELLNWIETILRLYSYVEEKSPAEIEAKIMDLNTVSNYYEFCAEVFGKKFSQFAGFNLHRIMRSNVTAAKFFLS